MAQGRVEDHEHYRRLEQLYLSAPCNDLYEPELRVGDGTAVLRIAVKPSYLSGHGTLHGSVFFKALDDAAAFAIYSVEEMAAVTTSFTLYFMRPVTGGTIEAHGRVVNSSSRLHVAEAEVHCDGREVARGSGTFMRTNASFASLPGYGSAS